MEPKIKKARKDAKFLKEYSTILSERPKNLQIGGANGEMRNLTKKRREGGETLVKAATALLICPDPVTGAAALPLLAAAAIKSKKKSNDIENVYLSVSEIASELSASRL